MGHDMYQLTPEYFLRDSVRGTDYENEPENFDSEELGLFLESTRCDFEVYEKTLARYEELEDEVYEC
jgi:hypothetical protein